jgi:hypothetical protein
MPRNLTDLMESAVASAPPELHHATDITRLAERHQRRRTTFMAAAAALALVVVAGGAVGLIRGGRDATPEPAGHHRYGQTVDVSQAVPAGTLPGYRLQPWTVPSVQRFGSASEILPTYQAVDPAGRLLVVEARSGNPLQGPFRARLYDTAGGAAQPLQAPASPGSVGSVPISWLPVFYGSDHLLWHASTGLSASKDGFHITDLQGGHDEFVRAAFRVGNESVRADAEDVTGGSMWMKGSFRPPSKSGLSVFNIFRGTFSGEVSKVGTDAVALDVGAGTAGWLTTRGQVFVQAATGAPPQQVRVPVNPGCRVVPADSQSVAAFAVTSSAVAISERCGSGGKTTEQVVAFDLSGRPLVRITRVTPFNLSFAGDALLFQANGLVLRYDLVTGSLSRLNAAPAAGRVLQPPRGAGTYVLWYDGRGGHVAAFGD